MKKWHSYLYSFFIPVISLLLVYISIGIYPFGDLSLLTVDMYNQYISFFSYFKSILLGNNDIFYTFSKNLGGDMIGILSYYLMSPLNLVFLLFPLEHFTEAIMVLSLLKTGLAGVTMNHYLKSKKILPYSILFSNAYALMGYMLVYQQNIMWLDGVILLPLVILGIDRIFENKSFLFYSSFLALSLVTNYYIGYMICLFSVLYALMKFIASYDWKGNFFKYMGRFTAGSLLGGGLAAIILIPTAFSLAGGKAELNPDLFTFTQNFEWADFLSKFIIGSTNVNEIINGLPNVYVGSFTLSCLGFFFMQKGIPLRKKMAYLLGFAIILASFYYNGLNLIWHGLNTPAWFPYRYSFMFGFLAVKVAYESFIIFLEKSISTFQLIVTISIGLLYVIFMANRSYEYIDGNNAKITFFCLIASILLLLAFSHTKKPLRNHLFVIMLAFSFFELTYNSHETLKQLAYAPRTDFVVGVEKVHPITKEILAEDDSFYRMAKDFQFNRNDPMLYGYSGLSHYSSNEKTFVKDFLGNLGFRNNGNWAYYGKGNTLTVDSLLGVKYLLSSEMEHENYMLLKKDNSLNVYENPYALPIGMMVKNQTEDIDLAQGNPFEVQNEWMNSIVLDSRDEVMKRTNAVAIELENALQGTNEYGTVYEKIDATKEATVTYTISVGKDAPYYAFFPSGYWIPTELVINNTWSGTYFDAYNYNIVPLGDYSEGEEITVTFRIDSGKVIILEELFYYEDLDVFKNNYADLSSNQYDVAARTSSSFSGTIQSVKGKETLLFTIPYEDAWQIKVDGEIKESKSIFQTFLAVDLEPGEHTVELKYIPKGWFVGVAITSSSAIIIIVLLIRIKRSKRKH